MQSKRMIHIVAVTACMILPAASARGEFYEQVARGLFLTGFRLDATRNPITNGIDFSSGRSFFNDTLNFGVGTLTLTGGLSFDGSINRRPIPGLSFGLQSSASPDGAPVPLSYTLTIPRALETVTVTGQATIQTGFSVDQTGFYSRTVSIQNRGEVRTTGLVESTNNIDFDIGPINQVGNIYLDAAGGLVNLLGGDGDAISNLPNAGPILSLSQFDVEQLDLEDQEQLEAYINAALLEGITQAATDPTIGKPMAAVPEPSTLALLGVCGATTYMSARSRRRMAR